MINKIIRIQIKLFYYKIMPKVFYQIMNMIFKNKTKKMKKKNKLQYKIIISQDNNKMLIQINKIFFPKDKII